MPSPLALIHINFFFSVIVILCGFVSAYCCLIEEGYKTKFTGKQEVRKRRIKTAGHSRSLANDRINPLKKNAIESEIEKIHDDDVKKRMNGDDHDLDCDFCCDRGFCCGHCLLVIGGEIVMMMRIGLVFEHQNEALAFLSLWVPKLRLRRKKRGCCDVPLDFCFCCGFDVEELCSLLHPHASCALDHVYRVARMRMNARGAVLAVHQDEGRLGRSHDQGLSEKKKRLSKERIFFA